LRPVVHLLFLRRETFRIRSAWGNTSICPIALEILVCFIPFRYCPCPLLCHFLCGSHYSSLFLIYGFTSSYHAPLDFHATFQELYSLVTRFNWLLMGFLFCMKHVLAHKRVCLQHLLFLDLDSLIIISFSVVRILGFLLSDFPFPSLFGSSFLPFLFSLFLPLSLYSFLVWPVYRWRSYLL